VVVPHYLKDYYTGVLVTFGEEKLLHEPLQGMPLATNTYFDITNNHGNGIKPRLKWEFLSKFGSKSSWLGPGRAGSLWHQDLADVPARVHHSFPTGASPGEQTQLSVRHGVRLF